MSGSAKDMKKRAIVRKMLKAKRWQVESDRSVAAEAEVGRGLVTMVRREMIGLGEHPQWEPRGSIQSSRDHYKPGQSARGGYVFDEAGKVIREIVWLKRQAMLRKKAKAATRPR